MNTLHLYSPAHYHCDEIVVGTAEGLLALRDAIDAALTQAAPAIADVESFVNDGEGYTLVVLHLTDEQAKRLDTPYTDREIVSDGPAAVPAWRWRFAFQRAQMRAELAAGCDDDRRAWIEKTLRYHEGNSGADALAQIDGLLTTESICPPLNTINTRERP